MRLLCGFWCCDLCCVACCAVFVVCGWVFGFCVLRLGFGCVILLMLVAWWCGFVVGLFAFIGLRMCGMLCNGGVLVLEGFYTDYFVCLLGVRLLCALWLAFARLFAV